MRCRARVDPSSPAASSRRVGGRRDERRDQDVLEHGALRQQAVVLEDEPDRVLRNAASSRGREQNGFTPSSVTLPDDGRLEPAEDIEQRALAAARRSHDRGRVAGRQLERHVGQHAQRAARGGVLLARGRRPSAFLNLRAKARSYLTIQISNGFKTTLSAAPAFRPEIQRGSINPRRPNTPPASDPSTARCS